MPNSITPDIKNYIKSHLFLTLLQKTQKNKKTITCIMKDQLYLKSIDFIKKYELNKQKKIYINQSIHKKNIHSCIHINSEASYFVYDIIKDKIKYQIVIKQDGTYFFNIFNTLIHTENDYLTSRYRDKKIIYSNIETTGYLSLFSSCTILCFIESSFYNSIDMALLKDSLSLEFDINLKEREFYHLCAFLELSNYICYLYKK